MRLAAGLRLSALGAAGSDLEILRLAGSSPPSRMRQ